MFLALWMWNMDIETEGYSLLYHWKNEYILEIEIDPVKMKLAQYKQKWLNHIKRMEDIRYPKQFLDYGHVKDLDDH